MSDNDWRERERDRFYESVYKFVPWARESWWRNALVEDDSPIKDHYTHVSAVDCLQIAYTASEGHGIADRQTRMKPGRYLAKFFPALTPTEIQRWAGVWAHEHETPELLIATTEDEIERVYLNGPDSCMAHNVGDYRSPFHPVRVYAAGDLAVAYITRADDKERITARVLVWPEKKFYGRIYGDEYRIGKALSSAGYTEGSMDGARLARYPHEGFFVCPYIDYADQVRDNGTHLIIDNDGDINCKNTNGLSGEPDQPCAHCGDRYAEDDLCYYDDYDGSLCNSCADDLMTECHYCEAMYADDNVTYIDSLSYSVCRRCLDRRFTSCQSCDEYVHDNDIHNTGNNASICPSCLNNDYTFCEPCEEYWPHDAINSKGVCQNCAVEETTETEETNAEDPA